MGHHRTTIPRLLKGDELTQALAGIGMRFAAMPDWNANIEDTLVSASVEGMENDDLRVLAVLVEWLGIHHAWVNADRLTRAVREQKGQRVRAFWTAVGQWLNKDRRLRRITETYRGPRVDVLCSGTEFQIRRRGEDARFTGTVLRVPQGLLRDRASDVMSAQELAGRHRTYRARIQMGPSYRADMWTLLEVEPSLTPSELARRAYGSFATAWQVTRDFLCLAA